MLLLQLIETQSIAVPAIGNAEPATAIGIFSCPCDQYPVPLMARGGQQQSTRKLRSQSRFQLLCVTNFMEIKPFFRFSQTEHRTVAD